MEVAGSGGLILELLGFEEEGGALARSDGLAADQRAMKSSIRGLGMGGFYTKQRGGGNADSDCVRP